MLADLIGVPWLVRYCGGDSSQMCARRGFTRARRPRSACGSRARRRPAARRRRSRAPSPAFASVRKPSPTTGSATATRPTRRPRPGTGCRSPASSAADRPGRGALPACSRNSTTSDGNRMMPPAIDRHDHRDQRVARRGGVLDRESRQQVGRLAERPAGDHRRDRERGGVAGRLVPPPEHQHERGAAGDDRDDQPRAAPGPRAARGTGAGASACSGIRPPRRRRARRSRPRSARGCGTPPPSPGRRGARRRPRGTPRRGTR